MTSRCDSAGDELGGFSQSSLTDAMLRTLKELMREARGCTVLPEGKDFRRSSLIGAACERC